MAEIGAVVPIVGETRNGLVVLSIHKLTARKSGRFVTVDRGAIPKNLLESESEADDST